MQIELFEITTEKQLQAAHEFVVNKPYLDVLEVCKVGGIAKFIVSDRHFTPTEFFYLGALFQLQLSKNLLDANFNHK